MSTVVTLPRGQLQVPRPTNNRSASAIPSSFELVPSTSYNLDCAEEQWTPPTLLCGPRRRRRRAISFSSVTQAVHADIRQRVRQQMMGWPVDLRRFLAGAFAGAISKTATAPIESVRMQIMTGNKEGVWRIVAQTWESGGVLAFFSGNEADVLRTMPTKAIELTSFDLYKRLLGSRSRGADGKRAHPGGVATAVAGALAGITSTVAMFPLETVRTRLAVDHAKYRGVATAFRTIVASEGLPALYRGLGASVLGTIPYSAIRLGSYDGLKWAYRRATGQESVPPHVTAIFGAVAAVASSSASFPLEVVRRRAMMGTAPAAGTVAALMAIARNEGVGALYAGVGLTWLKQAPQYGVTFLMYDLAKAWLAAEAENGHGGRDTVHATGKHELPAKASVQEQSGNGWSPLRGLRVQVSSA